MSSLTALITIFSLLLGFFLLVPGKIQNNKRADDFELVKKGITELLTTGNKPNYFFNALKNYQLTHLFRTDDKVFEYGDVICTLCNLVLDLIINAIRSNIDEDEIVTSVKFLCTVLGIENERVCNGSIDMHWRIYIYIIRNSNTTSHRFCSLYYQAIGCDGDGESDWILELPEGNSLERPLPNNTESFNILHLSDIHHDPRYLVNGNSDCDEPVCCQDDQGEPTSEDKACGYWTDYRNSDIPWHLVEETIRQTNTHEFDYVYYTGDIISHRSWDTSIENNTRDISKLYEYFRDAIKVPVYPVFGNHESHPVNQWASDGNSNKNLSTNWLYELAYNQWSVWLPENTKNTILRGGYYTVSPRPGFRVIALNNNVCYTDNWWLIFDDFDPFGQLQWLIDTLKKSEEDNESVHIIAHVPTGQAYCLRIWSINYRRIVERFANTITGQFNGHTHRDEFQVFYNSSNASQAIGVAFNGASVTPYSYSNPSYKLYQIQKDNYNILDYEEWTFNLTLANLVTTEQPEWYQLYKFTEAYNTENLEAEEVAKVLIKMAEDHSLLEKFFIYNFRNGDPGLNEGCDDSCNKQNLCSLATSVIGDTTQCDYLLEIYDQNL